MSGVWVLGAPGADAPHSDDILGQEADVRMSPEWRLQGSRACVYVCVDFSGRGGG